MDYQRSHDGSMKQISTNTVLFQIFQFLVYIFVNVEKITSKWILLSSLSHSHLPNNPPFCTICYIIWLLSSYWINTSELLWKYILYFIKWYWQIVRYFHSILSCRNRRTLRICNDDEPINCWSKWIQKWMTIFNESRRPQGSNIHSNRIARKPPHEFYHANQWHCDWLYQLSPSTPAYIACWLLI